VIIRDVLYEIGEFGEKRKEEDILIERERGDFVLRRWCYYGRQ